MSQAWQVDFPPFYTLQPHRETRAKQLQAWREVVLDHCRRSKITKFEVNRIQDSSPFHNKKLQRKAQPELFEAVLEDLRHHGHLEWIDKDKKRCHVYWHTPEQWGALVYAWAKENGMSGGGICTLFEISEGEDTKTEPFHGLEQDMLVKALKSLQLQKKAELFDGNEGVKFF